jgi:hypothetical protein
MRQLKTTRPPRKMPSLNKIAQHWGREQEDCSCCWRCDRTCSPVRAHIIDRCYDGLDGPQNLWLLCAPCHYEQPTSRPEDYWHTMAYLIGVDEWQRLYVNVMRIMNAAQIPNLFNPTCVCKDVTEDQYLASKRWTESDFALARSGSAGADAQSACKRFRSECAACKGVA